MAGVDPFDLFPTIRGIMNTTKRNFPRDQLPTSKINKVNIGNVRARAER